MDDNYSLSEYIIIWDYTKFRIDRKFNNSLVLSGWVSSNELVTQFKRIEAETENFDYLLMQKRLSTILKFFLFIGCLVTIIGFFHLAISYVVALSLVFVLISLFIGFYKFNYYKENLHFYLECVADGLKEVNKSYFDPKGLIMEYQHKSLKFTIKPKETKLKQD